MSTRTHLSISEVLSLLKEDFPDLTITKIRYLESQGLIDPERTASGYRKFYKFDIDRLRWILRQQRENFLPLKVIKNRLDDSDGRTPTEDIDPSAPLELDLARDPGHADPPPIWMADHAKSTEHAPTTTDRIDDIPASRSEEGDDMNGATNEPLNPAPQNEPVVKTGESIPKSTAPSNPSPAASVPASPPKAVSQPTHVPDLQEGPRPSEPAKAPTLDAGATDVSLTRTELLKAANLTDRQLNDLESFGIVSSAVDDLYGSAALITAKHASTMLHLGIEPRHLRAYKVAADREAGLYEQMLLPLLRQRNPAARTEAMQRLERATRAGNALHAAMLKQALRGLLRSGNS